MDSTEQILAEIAALAAANADSPTTLAAADALRIGTGRTRMFVGREHGASLSYFYVDNEPGQGPGLHRHPYTETWLVLDGQARLIRDDGHLEVGSGDTATVRPGVWHGFTNIGPGRLRILCLHASDRIIQEWKDAPGRLDIPSIAR